MSTSSDTRVSFVTMVVGTTGYTTPRHTIMRTVMLECSAYMQVLILLVYVSFLVSVPNRQSCCAEPSTRQQQQLLIVDDIANCVPVSDIIANVQLVDECYIDFVCV